jgi:hypothetical protein
MKSLHSLNFFNLFFLHISISFLYNFTNKEKLKLDLYYFFRSQTRNKGGG